MSVEDSEYPVGRVGAYQWGLEDAEFDNLVVTAYSNTRDVDWPFPWEID